MKTPFCSSHHPSRCYYERWTMPHWRQAGPATTCEVSYHYCRSFCEEKCGTSLYSKRAGREAARDGSGLRSAVLPVER